MIDYRDKPDRCDLCKNNDHIEADYDESFGSGIPFIIEEEGPDTEKEMIWVCWKHAEILRGAINTAGK